MTKIKTEHKTLPAGRERKLIILIKEERITDFLTIRILELIIKGTEGQIIKEINLLINLKEKGRNLVPFIIKIQINVNL